MKELNSFLLIFTNNILKLFLIYPIVVGFVKGPVYAESII